MPIFFGSGGKGGDEKKKNTRQDSNEEEKRRAALDRVQVPVKKNSMRLNKPPVKERSFKGRDILGTPVAPGVELDEYGIPLIHDGKDEKRKAHQDSKKQHNSKPQPLQQPRSPVPGGQPQGYYYPPQQQPHYPGAYPPNYPHNYPPQQYPPQGYPQNYAYGNHPSSQPSSPDRRAGGGETTLDDPEVRAFMEKRRQKQQQLKELQLQKDLVAEARRLHISPETLAAASAESSRRSPVPTPTAERRPDSTKSQASQASRHSTAHTAPEAVPESSGSTQRSKKDYSDMNYFHFPHFSPSNQNHHQQQQYHHAHNPMSPTHQAMLDPSNILHPSNSLAFKAASALFQLAKKHPTVHHLPPEAIMISASQLASMWVNQVGFYLSKLPPSQSNPPSAVPSPAMVARSHPPTPQVMQRKLSSKASFRKEVIDSMSVKLGDRILRVESKEKIALRKSGSGESPRISKSKSRSSDSAGQKGRKWQCKVCTLLNKSSYLACEACGATNE